VEPGVGWGDAVAVYQREPTHAPALQNRIARAIEGRMAITIEIFFSRLAKREICHANMSLHHLYDYLGSAMLTGWN
jgi:hypothetical protein